jgi:MbtH protein
MSHHPEEHTMDDSDEDAIFDVVRNDEEQYSIWTVDQPVPAGWHPVGMRGTRRACLDYIDEHWVDLRPRSLRERHEARRARAVAREPDEATG